LTDQVNVLDTIPVVGGFGAGQGAESDSSAPEPKRLRGSEAAGTPLICERPQPVFGGSVIQSARMPGLL
jgi:hypothetical protein